VKKWLGGGRGAADVYRLSSELPTNDAYKHLLYTAQTIPNNIFKHTPSAIVERKWHSDATTTMLSHVRA
jgi:hypothetical protein